MLPFAYKHIYLLAKFLDIELLGQRICEFVILICIAKLPSREVTFPLVLRIKMSVNLNGEKYATVRLECYISHLIIFYILLSHLYFLFDELPYIFCWVVNLFLF